MKSSLAAVASLFVCCLAIQSGYSQPVVGPNVDVTGGDDPGGKPQEEVTIAIHPTNPNIIVAGAHDHRLADQGVFRWHGYYRSVDGGNTWSVSLVPGFPGDNSPAGLSSALHGFERTTYAYLAFDRQGNVYYSGIADKFRHNGNVGQSICFVAKYVNDGADFAFVTSFDTVCDHTLVAVDRSGGPNDGNVYVTYLGKRKGRSVGLLSRSTDGGVTFSNPVLVSDSFPSGITVDPAGKVYVVGLDCLVTSGICVARSDDGGATFRPAVLAATGGKGEFVPLPGNDFWAATWPQIAADGTGVYVVYDDYPNGLTDGDIFLARSTDGGATWSTPVRVNDVTTNHQFFGSIAVVAGRLDVIWYDARLGQEPDGTITALDVFYASSTDGGASFSSSVRVTSASFDPNLVISSTRGLHSFGEYIQVASTPTAVHAVWADNRNACDFIDPVLGCTDMDIYTATITPGP